MDYGPASAGPYLLFARRHPTLVLVQERDAVRTERKTVMLFGGKRDHGEAPHPTTILRDVIEIVAILAAGIWAFYVFAYENRIKPAMAKPDINLTASVQRLSERNGLIAIGIHLRFANIGTVRAHFLGVAVNVYGQRVFVTKPHPASKINGLRYDYRPFYGTAPRVTVYSSAYLTKLGNSSTGQDIAIDPGTTIENYRMFYVPSGRFDLLTVGIDAPYTKFDDHTIPTQLVIGPQRDVRVVTKLTPQIEQYNITPVTSLDLR